VVTFVPPEFFSAAETGGTDVKAVAGFANGIRAFDSDGVGEIATAAVAFDLKTGFSHGCGSLLVRRERRGERIYSVFLLAAEVVSSCE
jgi:hypothetical protein